MKVATFDARTRSLLTLCRDLEPYFRKNAELPIDLEIEYTKLSESEQNFVGGWFLRDAVAMGQMDVTDVFHAAPRYAHDLARIKRNRRRLRLAFEAISFIAAIAALIWAVRSSN